MDATLTSIFDLGPSKKLQLVEDLWDDLAADPEVVPVYEWQIKELAQRKARLMNTSTSTLTWEEAKRRARHSHER